MEGIKVGDVVKRLNAVSKHGTYLWIVKEVFEKHFVVIPFKPREVMVEKRLMHKWVNLNEEVKGGRR